MTEPVRIGSAALPAPAPETPDNSEHFDIPGMVAEASYDPATILADVAESLGSAVEDTFVTLPVPNRPDYQLKFRTRIDYDDLRLWIRRAKDSKDKTDPHMLRLSFAVLSNTNVGVIFRGNEVPSRDGGNLLISTPEFQSLIKASIGNSVPAAIRKLYGSDGHIIMTMNKIMEEAGYGDIDLEDGDNPLTR